MKKKLQYRDLTDGFYQYLLALKPEPLSMTTASFYRALVSAAIHKHAAGPLDAEGLTAYALNVYTLSPSQSRGLQAAWGHFQRYAATQGLMVPTLPHREFVHSGPPPAAVYDLRACTIRLPLTSFVDLRWFTVKAVGPKNIQLHVQLETGRMVSFQLTAKGIAALHTLQTWGYPKGVPAGYSFIIPDTPEAECGLSPTRMSKLLRTERNVRAPALVTGAGVGALHNPEALAPTMTPGNPFPTFTQPAPPRAPQVDPLLAYLDRNANKPSPTPGRPLFGPGSADEERFLTPEERARMPTVIMLNQSKVIPPGTAPVNSTPFGVVFDTPESIPTPESNEE